MTEKNISIKYIVEKLYRDLGINSEIPFEDVVEWAGEALLFIGAFSQFNKELKELPVVNYKASLPCNFHKLIQLSYNGYPVRYSGSSFDTAYHCTDCINLKCSCEDTYYINDSYIITSFPEGTICISYLAMPVDEEGYPKIPDDVYYSKAISSYVTFMLDRQSWRASRIPDKVYQESKADWDWYCQAARSKANMPSLAQLESIKNILQRLIPLQNEFKQGFGRLGSQEQRYTH